MWFLPTHRRPERCRETLLSLAGCTTPGIVLINGDATGYQDMPLPNTDWELIQVPLNLGLCESLRWFYSLHPDEPWYGTFGDDDIALSEGWDVKLIAAAGHDKLAQGFNRDRGDWPLHGFMTWGGDLVRAVGWLAPPGLWHWYFDAYWKTLAERTGRLVTCDDVKIATRHYIRGTAEHDETYRIGESRKDEDQAVFLRWMRDPAGREAAEKRIKSMESHG